MDTLLLLLMLLSPCMLLPSTVRATHITPLRCFS